MERNIPFGAVQVTVSRKSDGGSDIHILMSDHTFDHYIQDLAAKRGRSVTDVIVEALRLGVLFNKSLDNPNKGLCVMDRGVIRQLVGFG